ncbi:Carbonic anhydrase 13 [Pteropus alecto]|uniref:Carbonic anhydrase 13 n=1 Tax=Pteropus alecto TaxID=9402 RepID=L5JSP7_PTEAL|nr:Carbonic anhydrase 13 [Pteropus alecto]
MDGGAKASLAGAGPGKGLKIRPRHLPDLDPAPKARGAFPTASSDTCHRGVPCATAAVTRGPIHWKEFFPIADGDRQSPIEIKTEEARYDSSLQPLSIQYDPRSARIISNNGHSFSVDFDDTEDKSVLRGGPLAGTYRLRQFHLHWGRSDDHGSEHRVDGVCFAAEVSPWPSSPLCLQARDTDAPCLGPRRVIRTRSDTVTISFEISCFQIGEFNPQLQKITDILDSIKEKGKQTRFTNFDPSSLLPPSWDYWTYPGSLTVPPLLESVTWIVLKQPIKISSQQVR